MKAAVIFLLCVSAIKAVPKSPRIVGGEEALPGEFPYSAAVYTTREDGTFFCAGALLNDQWVITGGHCVLRAVSFRVLLGTHSLAGDPYDVQIALSDTFVLHPEYDDESLLNDIGLIKFTDPVQFTTYVQPLRLSDEPISEGTLGIVLGWGQTSDADSDLSDTLRYVTVTSISGEDCRLTYGDQVTEHAVCFRGVENEGPCLGDGGSPVIQHRSTGFTTIIAVTSFLSGNGCDNRDPSGYTEVYPFVDWITETISTN